MQAPARCACWLRSGPGPLAAQDRPPQSPPPHRTALLCSSSSGPDAASREGNGGTGPDMGAETGGRDHDSECSSMESPAGRREVGGGRHMPISHRGVESGQSGGAPPVIYHDNSDRCRPCRHLALFPILSRTLRVVTRSGQDARRRVTSSGLFSSRRFWNILYQLRLLMGLFWKGGGVQNQNPQLANRPQGKCCFRLAN